VLAGHSFGGLIARLYRDLYPDEVVGLALLESAHEAQWTRLPGAVRQLLDRSIAGSRANADSARANVLDEADVAPHRFFVMREDVWREYRRQSVDSDHLQAQVDELVVIDRVAVEVTATAPMGDLPLAVLSSAREFDPYRATPIPVDEANAIWLELQSELARLSSNVVHVVSMTGPHTIQYEEPGIVLGVLIELVERVRAK
jgi:pimeloyl-ACP methyl ester carboxylesterase